jgi:hypothetical protein
LKTKNERLTELWRRLRELTPCSSFQEMREQLDITLNQVENELTPFPYDPNQLDPSRQWEPTDRMYAIQDDNIDDMPGNPLVKRMKSAGHNAFIGANGSIEVRSKKRPDGSRAIPPQTGALVFARAGRDGRGVWEL